MKNSIKLFAKILYIFSSLLLINCSDSDEFNAPNQFSDVYFENSLNKSFNEFGAEVGEAITLLDLSQSALTHEWILESNGSVFIRDFEDKDTLNLKPFIIPGAEKVSNATKVNILFQTPGEKIIRLKNTFEEEVTYIPPTLREEKEEVIGSVMENGVWVFDQEFKVRVFDKVKAAFTVSQDGNVIANVTANDDPQAGDASKWPEIVIESGGALIFTDNSTVGEPNSRSWRLNNTSLDTNAEEDEQQQLEVKYFSLGEFTAGEIQVDRFNAFKGGNDVKLIPLNIKVVPSSAPFVPVDTGDVVDFNTLKLNTTASIAAVGTDFTGFVANITNANQPSLSLQIDVTSVSVDPESNNTLLLSLSERLYEDDIVTLSYTSDGNITSVDSRTFQSFTDVKVNTNAEVLGNILDAKYYGFEGGLAQEEHGWFVQHPGQITISPEKPFSGNNSIKYDNTDATLARAVAGEIAATADARIGLEEGTYDFSMKVWIDPTEAPRGVSLIVRSPFNNIFFDFEGQPTGEWVTLVVRKDMAAVDPPSKINFQVAGGNFGGAGVFFADDISIKRVELRP
ncbi:hypothetical protein [Aquimarina agarilytica]|uniref:hypothetical protein n=1 Tax=Aquimarina agarilytica TaxID=1087449 RepID=UPI0012F8FB90|nr:hypothetical protein [Aquimarina agarilytica]